MQTLLSFSGDQSRCVTSQTSVRPYGKGVNILTESGISSNISTIKSPADKLKTMKAKQNLQLLQFLHNRMTSHPISAIRIDMF
jgi:hypothetical protein